MHLITWISPSNLNRRYFELPKMFLMLSILGSVESQTPKTFTLFSGHLKFFSGKRFSLFATIDPIYRASVFLLLSLRPDILPKVLIVLCGVVNDSLVLLRMKVVSFVYWLILIFELFTDIPLMFLFNLVTLAKISADNINMYDERGQSCLTPL